MESRGWMARPSEPRLLAPASAAHERDLMRFISLENKSVRLRIFTYAET